jgi:hypothetical protein
LLIFDIHAGLITQCAKEGHNPNSCAWGVFFLSKFDSNVRPIHPIIVYDDNDGDGIFETNEYTPNYRRDKDKNNTNYIRHRTFTWDELQNTERVSVRGGNHKNSRYFDDSILKQASSNVEKMGLFNNDNYHYWDNNCQDYISSIVAEYDRLVAKKKKK